MGTKRFILNKNYSTPLEVETSPTLVETLDETLDNMTVVLKANSNPNPISPLQVFELQEYIDGAWTTIVPLLVSADNVELFSAKPLLYKHTLTLVQGSQFLTKHLSRNTVFSTSLQGDTFTTTVSSSLYAKVKEGSQYALAPEFSNFERFSPTDVQGLIQLKNRSIVSIDMSINFKKQVTDKFIKTFDSANDITMLTQYQKTVYPKKWIDLYDGATHPEYIGNFPVIVFEHSGGGVDRDRLWNLNSDGLYNAINKSTVRVPQSIIDWINTKVEGSITIFILNVDTTNGTFLNSPAFSDALMVVKGRTNYASLRLDFNVRAVENSVYYVLDTLLKQYMQETAEYNSTNDNTIKPLFLLPTLLHNPDLYYLLNNTSSPNFIFTQTTIFDAISEIFKLFDATFTIDSDGYLDIEYFNDLEQTTILLENMAGRNSSISEEKFATSSISYFQNAKVIDRYPNSADTNATAPVRSKSLGVPNQEDFVFATPKPIDIIKKAFIQTDYGLTTKTQLIYKTGTPGISGYASYYRIVFANENKPLDISSCVVEQSLWSLLPTTISLPVNGNWNEPGMYNSFTYTRGTNFIDVSGNYQTTFNIRKTIIQNVIKTAIAREYGWGGPISTGVQSDFYFTEPDFRKIRLAVEYVALTDGRLKIESLEQKYNGEILSNQANGSIDINKLGLNMEGLNLKLGQPTLTLSISFSNWADRITKGQFFFDELGQKWVANICSYTFLTSDMISATIQFVKNFNGLSQRIQLAREKRLTNISNELTTKCEDNYNEYVYYYTPNSSIINSERIVFTNVSKQTQEFFNSIAMTFNSTLPSKIVSYGDGDIPFTPDTITPSASGFIAFNNLSSDNKHIYSGIGYIAYIDDSTSGGIQIAPNSDLTGTPIVAPLSSGNADTITFDTILREFVFTQTDDFSDYDFQVGDRINFYAIKDDTSIVGVGITAYKHPNDIYPTATDFSFNDMRSYIFENSYKVEYALITPRDSKGSTFVVDGNERANIFIPLVVYGSGNSVCFEMSFDSPINAGNQLLTDYESSIWDGGYFSRAVLYTDNEGFADQFDINFVKLQEPITEYFPEAKKDNLNNYIPTFSFGNMTNFKYYKKPNEIFALNYQVHFLPLPSRIETDFLSNEFIKNNGFANGLNGKTFYLYYAVVGKYSILDIKGRTTDTIKEITSVSSVANTGTRKLTMTFYFASVSNYQNVSSWAICDENGNIYFSSNTPLASATTCQVLFATRHHRLPNATPTPPEVNLLIELSGSYALISGSTVTDNNDGTLSIEENNPNVTESNGIIYANNY